MITLPDLKQTLLQLQCEFVAERNLVNPKEISWLQYDILNLLRNKRLAKPSEISRSLGVSRSKFSKAIKELKEKKYVLQEISHVDGRGLLTSITSDGITLLQSIDAGHDFLGKVTSEIFSLEQQKQFIDLSTQLIQVLHTERVKKDEHEYPD